MIRLHKWIAQAGVCSRRHAEDLIKQGRVTVNAKVATIGTKIDPTTDVVTVDGKQISTLPDHDRPIVVALNKPVRVVSTVKDPSGRTTVIDLLQDITQRIYPIGRLDYMTSGLLLLTNDGELAYRLTHPSFEIKKRYWARVKGHPSTQTIQQLREGIVLSDGPTHPAEVRWLKHDGPDAWIELAIHEGRNRQVRRMLEKVSHPVKALRRVKFGPIGLGTLSEGQYRLLSKDETRSLRRAVHLSDDDDQLK